MRFKEDSNQDSDKTDESSFMGIRIRENHTNSGRLGSRKLIVRENGTNSGVLGFCKLIVR
jgi:hypothetical protein